MKKMFSKLGVKAGMGVLKVRNTVRKILVDEKGSAQAIDAFGYIVIVVLVAIAAYQLLGGLIDSLFEKIQTHLKATFNI